MSYPPYINRMMAGGLVVAFIQFVVGAGLKSS